MPSYRDRDVGHGDPYFSNRTAPGTAWTFSRLFMREAGYLGPQPSDFTGDMAESWELSPDHLELTIKLRPSAKWHPVSPVDGREVVADDVAFSWQRLSEVGVNRELLANSVNPAAPIDTITAVDEKTISLRMASPSAGLFGLLSGSISGYLWLMPQEAATYDPRELLIGCGPWMIEDSSSSVELKFARNPGWYEADRLFFDGINQAILPEYAAGLAQFRAGHIYEFEVAPEDVLNTKREVPDLSMFALDPPQQSWITFFGWNPAYGAGTPFRDTRLRQAFSMAANRDLWINTFYNVDKLEAEGLEVETRWNSSIPTIWPGWWLDPQDEQAFGANAKYYQHNPEEATKLVSASGYEGQEIMAQYVTTGEYGPAFNAAVETMMNFASGAGMNFVISPVAWSTEWRPKVADAQGDFEGISFRASAGFQIPDVGEFSYSMYHKDGGANYTGFFSDSSSFQQGDPRINEILEKTRAEFETEQRQALIHEMQQIMAEQQYVILLPGSASRFALAWPALQNYNVFTGGLAQVGLWLDQSKAPN